MRIPKWKDVSILTKLITLYSLFIFFTVALVTGIIAWNYSQSTKNEIDEKSELIVEQFGENIDALVIHTNVTMIPRLIAQEPSLTQLFYFPLDNNLSLVAQIHEELRGYMFTNDLYDSIYVYAIGNSVAVSDTGSYFLRNGTYANGDIDWLINRPPSAGGEAILMRGFLPHHLLEERYRRDIISCFRSYPLGNDENAAKGTITVNLNVARLYQQYSVTNEAAFGDLFLVDGRGDIVAQPQDPFSFIRYREEDFLKTIAEGGESGFRATVLGEPHIVFHIPSQVGSWRYVYTVPYNIYSEKLSMIVNMGLFIALLTIMIPVLLAMAISKRMYNPIRELIIQSKRLNEELGNETGSENERSIGTALNALSARVGSLQSQITAYAPHLKASLIHQLLINKNVTREEIATQMERLDLSFPYPVFCSLHISLLEPGREETPMDGKTDSMIYNICQFIENLDADNCIRLASDMLGDGIAVIINTDLPQTINALANAIAEYCRMRLRIPARIGIGTQRESLLQLGAAYDQAVDALKYHFIYTRQTIFQVGWAIRLDALTQKPDPGLLAGLEKALGSGDPQQAAEASGSIIRALREQELSYATVQSTLLGMLRIISRKRSQFSLHSDEIFDQQLENLFYAANDLDDFQEMARYLIERLFALHRAEQAYKPAAEMEKIKEHIRQKIESKQSGEVTLSAVAAAFNRNPNYLSTMFSEQTGMKFKDFVVDTKLEYTERQLHIPGAKVYQIATDLDYYNVSYFIRIFHNKYGMTPKQYYDALHEQKRDEP